MSDKIDFVILWVDGGDPAWLEEKNQYSPVKVDYSSGSNRFRDWDNLHYLFRGIEKYAPWVNNVYFVTWGHLPKWMNTNHPKLKIINHKDYIPTNYLPTFNSNCIELNMFRIKELSEQFVLFNDDTFLLDHVKPDDFFKKGMPRDVFYLNPILPIGEKGRIAYTNLMNTGIINSHFKKKNVVKNNWTKIFCLRYGQKLLRTVLLMAWGDFVGFGNPHTPQAHLKSTFQEVWEKESDKLDATCRCSFRGLQDVSHWLMRYWNLCSGNFVPRSIKFAKYFNLSNNNKAIYSCIKNKKTKMICVNDMDPSIEFERIKEELIDVFNVNLGEKSSFEL